MQENSPIPKIRLGTPISAEGLRNLGFSAVVEKESRLRLLNQDGTFNVHRKGLNEFAVRNLYHWLLTMKWWSFLTTVVLLYFTINIFFATLFMMCGENSLFDASNQPMQDTFLRAFFLAFTHSGQSVTERFIRLGRLQICW